MTNRAGRLPLLQPMSQVAAECRSMSVAYALMRTKRGRGLLLGGVPGVPPANVVNPQRHYRLQLSSVLPHPVMFQPFVPLKAQ